MAKTVQQQWSHSASQASARAAGSHLTREARDRTLSQFFGAMRAAGYNQLRSVDQIAGRHLREYAEQRKANGIANRTIQNEMAHLRSVCRRSVAEAPELTNKALGIESQPGDRIGKKTAVDWPELNKWVSEAQGRGRDGIAMALEVQRELGLRAEEVIHMDKEMAQLWIRQIEQTGRVHVWKGTKGGRVRDASVPAPERALAVLQRAVTLQEARGGRGWLIQRANGQPAGDLKAAKSIYRNYLHRNGIDSHRCRYSYARELYDRYEEQGMCHWTACTRVGVDLGHGDGRGYYIDSVYLR